MAKKIIGLVARFALAVLAYVYVAICVAMFGAPVTPAWVAMEASGLIVVLVGVYATFYCITPSERRPAMLTATWRAIAAPGTMYREGGVCLGVGLVAGAVMFSISLLFGASASTAEIFAGVALIAGVWRTVFARFW